MNQRISELFWPFGVSLLTGLVSLYVATLGLFACGISISRWHMAAFMLPAASVAWLACPGAGIKKGKQVLGLLLAQIGAIGLMATVAAQFDDLSFDGMNNRIEPVIALSAGWNPVRDSAGASLSELGKSHPYLTGSVNAAAGYQYTLGSVLSSNLANWTGNLNAGKALTPLLVLASFGLVFGALASFSLSRGWSLALSLMAALNPVAIYQSSSFYVDGHTACLFTAMIFSALRLLVAPLDVTGVVALVVSFLGLSAAKTSGIFYGVIIDVVFLVFYAATHLKTLKPILIFVGVSVLITWPAGMLFRKVGGFPALTLEYLTTVTSPATTGYGVGTQSFGQNAMLKLDRVQIFVMSYFAPSDSMPSQVETKFPFYFNRRELALFEDLSPDPRAGGFGPLYGGCLLLALGSFGLLLLGRAPPVASLFPIVPILLSVGLTQTWWARWAPQGWLIPLALLLPVLAAWRNQPSGKRWILPFLTLFTGLLNSLLILLFYSIGCVKAQRVLNDQLAYLQRLPQPLQVHMPLFLSNRIWFIRSGIAYAPVSAEPPRPRLLLHRTQTRVALPPSFRAEADLSLSLQKEWEKRKLLEP